MYETHFEALSARYEELLLSSHQNEVILNQPLYQKTLRELSRLEPAIRDWEAYRKVLADIEGAQELRQDPDLKDEAARELTLLSGQKAALEEKLRLYLIPRDEDDDRSVLIEIRPGAGGEAAALFAECPLPTQAANQPRPRCRGVYFDRRSALPRRLSELAFAER